VSYEDSLAAEKKVYENCVDIHGLPPIFHYWSNRYLLPKLQPFGLTSPTDMFAQHLETVCATSPQPPRFVSLAAGNCDLEIELARGLHAQGHRFTLDCIDLNPTMLDRGRQAAQDLGLTELNFLPADLNTWTAAHEYDAVLASQSLHHVVNLEGLFDQVKQSLRPGASFLISDMIGRNGHQRWPEALAIVREFWRKLPPSYRFNQQLGYYEEQYENWDCSQEGFEGIRSQDILPLLLENFHFHFFLAYGNVIDPFIDRAFGHHFNPACEWDRTFIDEVQRRDEEELSSGRLKPTHMMAIVGNEPGMKPPESSVRKPDETVDPSPSKHPYDWIWPHDPKTELETACRHLAESGHEIKQRTQWALGLKTRFEDRTAWALSLEKDLQAHAAHIAALEQELETRTTWVNSLQTELANRTALAIALQQKVDQLEQQIEERTIWALNLEAELRPRKK
jgi:SAM-dependent methyltransferase